MLVFDIISLLQCLHVKMPYNRISRIDAMEFDVMNIANTNELVMNAQNELIMWYKRPACYITATLNGNLKLLKYLVAVQPFEIRQIVRCAIHNSHTHIMTWLESRFVFDISYIHDCKSSIKTMEWILKRFPQALNIETIAECFMFDRGNVGPWLLRNNPQFNIDSFGHITGGLMAAQWFVTGGTIDEVMAFIGTGTINVDSMLSDYALPLLYRIQSPTCTTDGINRAIVRGHIETAKWAINCGLGNPSTDVLSLAVINNNTSAIRDIDEHFNDLIEPVPDNGTTSVRYLNDCYARKIARK